MREFNIGIVGMGWVAGAHIETFKHVNGANVTAVCSRRSLDAAELSKQFGTSLKV
jgi:predicted dehydrogenase